MYQNPEEVKPGLEANDTGDYSWYNPAGWFGAASPPETPEKGNHEEDVEWAKNVVDYERIDIVAGHWLDMQFKLHGSRV